MPLYVADYLRDTRHLDAAEHGAYLLLIMQYWTAGCLPSDDSRLARIACMTESEWKKAKTVIEPFFEPGWRHKRIDEELAEARQLSSAAQHAGLASGRSRRTRKPTVDERIANGSPTEAPTDRQPSTNDPPTEAPTVDERIANGSGNDPPTETPTQNEPITITTTERDRMGEARARGPSAFTEGSKALANAFWTTLGFNNPIEIPPEFSGVDWRAVEWERAGWTPDLITAEARKLARDSPLKPLSYFEKVFATSFAKRQAPLPIVEVRAAEKLTVTHGTSQLRSGSLINAIDRELANLQAEEGADPELPKGTVLRLSG
jgi:uncharacterized protein YdaU (DUF1376 family)